MTTMRPKSHTWIYVTLIVVVAAAMIAGGLLYREQERSKEAHAKAQEFIGKLHAAGLPAPSEDAAVRLFGTDGGPYAGKPDASLLQAEYAWMHGTAGTASRPVIFSSEFLEAATIFVSVYEPDKLDAFKEWVNGLKTDETQ